MLKITKSESYSSVQRLTKFWEERYKPDLSRNSLCSDPWFYGELVKLTSPKKRASTRAKLQPSLVDINCQMAGILALELYEYIPNVVDLDEARRLTQYSYQVYIKLLEVYHQSPAVAQEKTSTLLAMAADSELSAWGIPDIKELAKEQKRQRLGAIA